MVPISLVSFCDQKKRQSERTLVEVEPLVPKLDALEDIVHNPQSSPISRRDSTSSTCGRVGLAKEQWPLAKALCSSHLSLEALHKVHNSRVVL